MKMSPAGAQTNFKLSSATQIQALNQIDTCILKVGLIMHIEEKSIHSTRPANTKNDDSGIQFEGFYFKIKNIVNCNHSYSKNTVLCYYIF